MVSMWRISRKDWIALLVQLQSEGYEREIPRQTLISRVSQHWDVASVSKILKILKDADALELIKVTSPSTFEITASELTTKAEETK